MLRLQDEEVQLLYERVERLAEQASIAEQLQRDNEELRGEVRALRRENTTLRSEQRADASDTAVTSAVLTALRESELAQQTNREAIVALRRHHAAQLAERDVEIGRLQTMLHSGPAGRAAAAAATTPTRRLTTGASAGSGYERSLTTRDPLQPTSSASSMGMRMSPMPPSSSGFQSSRLSDSEGWGVGGGLS